MIDRRHSKKRDAILDLVRSSRNHPKAQWVYEQLKPRFPDLSLGTVYRNIKILVEEGALVSAGVIYGEERFDGDLNCHAHAVCIHCGMIVDLPAYIEPVTIPGFAAEIRNTVFYGICNKCQSAGCQSGGGKSRGKKSGGYSQEIAALGR